MYSKVPVLVVDKVDEGRLGGLQDPETLKGNLDDRLSVAAFLSDLQSKAIFLLVEEFWVGFGDCHVNFA